MNRTVLGSATAVFFGLVLGACDPSSSNGGQGPVVTSTQYAVAGDVSRTGRADLRPDPRPRGPRENPAGTDEADGPMVIGTNFTYLAPDWSGEKVWAQDIPDSPWSNGANPWNEAFLDDSAMYEVIRPMHWNAVNPLDNGSTPRITRWEQRRQPDDPSNFAGAGIGVGAGPALAYEWQIDLANKLGADLWLNVPIWVDDEFFVELATLVHEQLDPELNVYVELANEIWNYKGEQNYAADKGAALGLQMPGKENSSFDTALRWQAYRSSQMWAAFESVWGEDSDRVINVLAGWSTNPWATENLHLKPLFEEEGFNPTDALPEAYAIAPYFGGNALPGSAPNVFDLMRTDIFEHRWNSPEAPGRLQNVIEQHAIVVEQYGMELVAYEGGQHLDNGAPGPNTDPRMYDLYLEYLEAMEPYFSVFVHYANVAPSKNERSFGTKTRTGQPDDEAPKYRALRDFIERE